MKRKSRRLATGLALASLAMVTACTSATSDDDKDKGSAEASDSPCVADAQKIVDSGKEPSPLAISDEAVDGSKMSGKSIWMVTILTNQWSTAVSEGFKSAAETIGAKPTVFDGQGQVNRWNEGIAQAVAQKADGIILLGIDPANVAEAVKDASDAGIPVVNAISGNYDDPVADGVFSNLSADYTQDSRYIAAWTLVDSGCDATMLYLYGTGVPLWESQKIGHDEVYADLCPDDCEVINKTVDLANAATDMPRTTQTELTQNQDINYVYPAWDSAVTFVEPAVLQTRPDVTIVSRDGIVQALDAIRDGGTQRVTVATPPEGWIGWATVDEIARALTGLEPSGTVVPTRLIDESNVGDSNDQIQPEYDGFEAVYEELWGVK
ncbi:sugar ABC transporter substrate-binding protein [Nocardioides sp. GXZ039]|uniref:sugar ABC transporter substrate-binding protein n=1 Tax=Nocardioides sp. GXZ039 TaxID=3136018 RepID=UPI0030F468FB